MNNNDVTNWTAYVKKQLRKHRRQYTEDDVQECLLRVVELDNAKDTHIHVRVANYILYYCKKMNRELVEIPTEHMDISVEPEPDPIDLDMLTTEQSTVIRMYYYEGMSIRQIAELLGKSVYQVSRIKAKALALLCPKNQTII
jgi:DNA-directed RNA polymerase specialized sigma24 family protein